MVESTMTGREIRKALKAFFDVQTEDNDGKVLYIFQGELAIETPEALFTVTNLS